VERGTAQSRFVLINVLRQPIPIWAIVAIPLDVERFVVTRISLALACPRINRRGQPPRGMGAGDLASAAVCAARVGVRTEPSTSSLDGPVLGGSRPLGHMAKCARIRRPVRSAPKPNNTDSAGLDQKRPTCTSGHVKARRFPS
jgi:hypothetical protein